jgi:3-phosphoshikimate 1-carboxyvinyltransferase
MRFRFEGEIPASKSMMNRALLVQSFFPELKIEGQSDCLDVRHMKAATTGFGSHHEMDAGEAGTTFRFLALRASREK